MVGNWTDSEISELLSVLLLLLLMAVVFITAICWNVLGLCIPASLCHACEIAQHVAVPTLGRCVLAGRGAAAHELLQAGSSGRFIVAVAVLQPPSSAEPHLRPSLPPGKGLVLEDGSLLPQLGSDSLRSHAALSQVLIDPLFQHCSLCD